MEIGKSQGHYCPVYFDPDFDEILELTTSFDTLRIGLHYDKEEYQKKEHLVIASGYGNTHNTLSWCLGQLNPRLRPNREGIKYQGLNAGSAILYEEDRRLWFNGDTVIEGEKLKPNEFLQYVLEPAKSILKEIIKQAISKQHLIE